MADDTPTTILGAAIPTTTFNATKDGSNNLTLQSTPRTNGGEVTVSNPLPVTITGGGTISGSVTLAAGTATIGALVANQSVNLTQVAGTAVATGHGTAAGALRVELPTDGTGVVGLRAGAATIGALVANQSVNVGQVAGANILTGAGTAAGAMRIALPTDQTLVATITGTVSTTGTTTVAGTVAATQSGTWTAQPGNTPNTIPWLVDLNHGEANALRGFASSTASTAFSVIAAQGSGVSVFVTSLELGNTSGTQVVATLNDTAATQLIIPANGGNNPRFSPALKVAANTAFTVSSSTAVNLILAGAQGFKQ